MIHVSKMGWIGMCIVSKDELNLVPHHFGIFAMPLWKSSFCNTNMQLSSLGHFSANAYISTVASDILGPAFWQLVHGSWDHKALFESCRLAADAFQYWFQGPECPDSKVNGPTWGPSGFCRPQTGPILAPRTLLLGWGTKSQFVDSAGVGVGVGGCGGCDTVSQKHRKWVIGNDGKTSKFIRLLF